jgi:hypothetical protein
MKAKHAIAGYILSVVFALGAGLYAAPILSPPIKIIKASSPDYRLSVNVTAECLDKTLSHAYHHQGSCSHHNGVFKKGLTLEERKY